MIPDSAHAVMPPAASVQHSGSHWQQELAGAIRDPGELLRLLKLQQYPELLAAAHRAATLFPLRVPHSYINRMQAGNPRDPLLLQVLPLQAELQAVPGFNRDAVGDLQAMRTPGLLQKYQGRALLITTGACAIHCRYCFRRAYPYDTAGFKTSYWQSVLEELRADPGLHEIILSGGDPLSLSNDKLAQLLDLLAEIPHIKRIRIHSRLPIVLPNRIDPGLIKLFNNYRFRFIHVIHANHPNEIDDSVAAAIERLNAGGIPVLNQTVLLKGINDTTEALIGLSEALIDIGVIPYYLHLLDRVQGSHHFEVNESCAIDLMKTLQQRLPGYMVPRLVREISGEPSKTLISIK